MGEDGRRRKATAVRPVQRMVTMEPPTTPGLDAPSTASAGLKQRAAQEIRRQVFAGEMKPGSKVKQEAIAARLGISKLPVREALIALEGEGLIQTIPRRGAFVASLTREDIRDHYWMLGVVSGLSAERAAARLSEEQTIQLSDIARRLEEANAPTSQEHLNFCFHRVINHASASRRLISELRLLSSAIPVGFYGSHSDWIASGVRDHREILDALLARSAGQARILTEGHFLRGGNQAVALLEARGFWS
jgi:DNA-binding GntR family transcriptional regulator